MGRVPPYKIKILQYFFLALLSNKILSFFGMTMVILDTIILLIVIAMAACIGSFLTAVSYRVPLGQDIVFRNSYCPNCKKPLQIKSLIPIVSWLLQKGKCSFCGCKISARYIIIECITTIFLVSFYLLNGFTFYTVYYCTLFSVLLLVVVIDWEHKIIPDSLQMILLFLAIIFNLTHPIDPLLSFFAAITYFALVYFMAELLSHIKKTEVIGGGDLKLIAISGLFLGFKLLPYFLIVSGILGIILGLLWRYIKKEEIFPFGPAISIALFLLSFLR